MNDGGYLKDFLTHPHIQLIMKKGMNETKKVKNVSVLKVYLYGTLMY